METLFLKLLNMSITAAWLTLAVILLRLILRKAPKWISALLWGLVGLRLICPFSIESMFSLIPSKETVPQNITVAPTPEIHTGIGVLNSAVNPILAQTSAPAPAESVNPMQTVLFIASAVWLAGLCLMLLYALFSYIRVRLQVREAVRGEGNIYLCDRVASPFILGLFRPKIYLPSYLSEEDTVFVLAHERAHLRRLDHIWKPLGFLLLSLYWFNPVLWAAYILLCRDIELACDEKVLRALGTDVKKPYSEALINCAVSRKSIAVCPLAFGEVGVKTRIKGILNYKKPAFWIILLAVIASIVAAVCFLTDPKENEIPAQTGTGTEIPAVPVTSLPADASPLLWFNRNEMGEEFWEERRIKIAAYPELTFIHRNGDMILCETDGTEQKLYSATLLKSVWFYDVTGDGNPDLCSDISEEHGFTSERIMIYDLALGRVCTLLEQGKTDLRLKEEGGKLGIEKSPYGQNQYAGFEELNAAYFEENSLFWYNLYYVEIQPSYPGAGRLDLAFGSGLYPEQLARREELKEEFPSCFGIDATNGLDIYVWQLAPQHYTYALLKRGQYPLAGGMDIWQIGVCADDMKLILSTYEITSEQVRVIHYQHPLSSYAVVFESEAQKESYINEIRYQLGLFTPGDFFQSFVPIYATIKHDIDKDGMEEAINLGMGPTSGIFTVTLTVSENGVNEYREVYQLEWFRDFTFAELDGKLYLLGGKEVTRRLEGGGTETVYITRRMLVTYEDGKIFFSNADSGDAAGE